MIHGEGETVVDGGDSTTSCVSFALDADVASRSLGAGHEFGAESLIFDVEIGGEVVEPLRPTGTVGIPV